MYVVKYMAMSAAAPARQGEGKLGVSTSDGDGERCVQSFFFFNSSFFNISIIHELDDI